MVPMKVGEDSMAFMFETCYLMKLTSHALDPKNLDNEYYKCWEGLTKHFDK